MSEVRRCLNCQKEIEGRIGKKFCNDYCKSNYNYVKNKPKESSLFKKIDKQLKLNRRILMDFNKAGKATVRKEILIAAGFDPNFFSHYWKNSQGDVYLFCYEYGFLKRTENGRTKFVLVTWQAYMS